MLSITSSDFFDATADPPSTTNTAKTSNSLTNFEQQIHTAVQNVEKAYQQTEQGLIINSLASEQNALKAARNNLEQLLSDDSFGIILNKFSDQQVKYKQALTQFHQQIKGLLKKLKKPAQM